MAAAGTCSDDAAGAVLNGGALVGGCNGVGGSIAPVGVPCVGAVSCPAGGCAGGSLLIIGAGRLNHTDSARSPARHTTMTTVTKVTRNNDNLGRAAGG